MDKVYILTTEDNFIEGVYATKEAAFNAIEADSITQEHGEEEFIPTAETVLLGYDIYAHYKEYYTRTNLLKTLLMWHLVDTLGHLKPTKITYNAKNGIVAHPPYYKNNYICN